MRTPLRPTQPTSAKRRLARTAAALAAASSLVVLTGGVAFGNDNKQTICHGTNSNHNPYVVNTPAKSGDVSGHADHVGPIWTPDLKSQHTAWGDIIPPFDYGDGEHFPGLNWSEEGQRIFRADCKIPPPVLSLTVVKTNDANHDADFHDDETATAAGSAVDFSVVVTNTSYVTVKLDTIVDTVGDTSIPLTCAVALAGTSLAPGASATCAFTVAAYSPADGESVTNTVTVTGHEGDDGDEGDENAQNTVTASDTSVVRTQVPPPQLSLTVTKTNDANGDSTYSPTETAPSAGLAVPYRVVVTNTSAVTVALDALSDAVGEAAGVPVTCSSALPEQLAAGASATCDFTLAGSSPAAGGSVTDVITATVHQVDNAENSAVQTASSTVLTATPPPVFPDLKVVKATLASGLNPGDVVTYSLTASNTGSGTAPSVVLDDALPAGTTLTRVSGTGWTCTGSAVHCVLDAPLAAGASAVVDVVLALAPDYAPATVVNTAVISPTDATPDDNTSTVTTPVTHTNDLSIVKTGPTGVAVGDDLTWTLTVTNDANTSASDVTVTDSLPTGLTPGTVTASGWTCTGTAEVSCTLDDDLAAGATASFSITANLSPGYTGSTVSNTAVVTPTDATPDDNTSTAVTPVTQTDAGGGGTTTTPGTPVTTPSEPGPGFTGGGGELAFTGAPVLQWAALAGLLLAVGLVLVRVGRTLRA